MSGGGEVKLDPQRTWLSLGAVGAGAISLVGGAVIVTRSYTELINSNRDVAKGQQRLEARMDDVSKDMVTGRQVQAWLEILRARNPALLIPDLPR